MYVVVVGAGKVGYYLAKTLLQEGHEVTLVERNRQKYAKLVHEFGDNLVRCNGSTPDGLERAGCARADVVVAVTGADETNLVICLLARQQFGVKRTIARINNPKNEEIFRALDAGVTVSSTTVIAGLIEQEVAARRIATLLTFAAGEMTILEMDLAEDSPATGRTVGELSVPSGSILVSVVRRGRVLIPSGNTVLEAGDRVIALTYTDHQAELREAVLG